MDSPPRQRAGAAMGRVSAWHGWGGVQVASAEVLAQEKEKRVGGQCGRRDAAANETREGQVDVEMDEVDEDVSRRVCCRVLQQAIYG